MSSEKSDLLCKSIHWKKYLTTIKSILSQSLIDEFPNNWAPEEMYLIDHLKRNHVQGSIHKFHQ